MVLPRDQNETVCAVVVKFQYNLKEAGTETKDGGERLRQMVPTMMEANEGNEDGDIHNFFSFESDNLELCPERNKSRQFDVVVKYHWQLTIQ